MSATLSDYWSRLGSLTASDWEGFYRIVRSALVRCPASELASLPDSKESYIDEFFVEKLYYRAQRADGSGGDTLSGGALCMFFRNFLRDYLDHYKAHPLSDEEPPDDVSDTRESDRNVNCFLAEIGVDALAERIQSLLEALPDWAMLMLRGHFCADDDVAVPMSKLCAGMSSYHYKAQKLGITLKKGSGDLQGFEHSLLGSWIGSLGVSIEPDNHDVIRFLLDAVCLEATARLEGDSA